MEFQTIRFKGLDPIIASSARDEVDRLKRRLELAPDHPYETSLWTGYWEAEADRDYHLALKAKAENPEDETIEIPEPPKSRKK